MIAGIDLTQLYRGITQWISAHPAEAVTALLAVWGWLSPRLPSSALKWLKKVGGDKKIQKLIAQAAQISTLKTNAEKRAWVVEQLEAAGMPTTIADMLVADVFQKIKEDL